LKDPVQVEVTPQATTVERIEQRVMFVDRPDKKRLLISLLRSLPIDRAIVFSRTKHGANRLATKLGKAKIEAAAIHGNKSQNARRRALDSFIAGDITVLIATDIASRGIDIDGVSHVINYDLPNEPESYVHRIGRTGRAGEDGVAISFCDATELEYLRDIQKLIGFAIEVDSDHEFHQDYEVPAVPAPRSKAGAGKSRSSSRRRRPRGPRKDGPRESGPRKDGPRKDGPRKQPSKSAGTTRSDGESRPRRARRSRRRRPKSKE
jgi:ATP-dependent RNA helicase RhlE